MAEYTRPDMIISGGQTGADESALHAAKALGIKTGGTAPKGWRICMPDGSNGSNPKLAEFGLVEHESAAYPPRTRKNVADSDGTVWFGYKGSGGAELTISTAREMGKHLTINPTPKELKEWCAMYQIKVLNVAGNRKSDLNPHVEFITYNTLIAAFT